MWNYISISLASSLDVETKNGAGRACSTPVRCGFGMSDTPEPGPSARISKVMCFQGCVAVSQRDVHGRTSAAYFDQRGGTIAGWVALSAPPTRVPSPFDLTCPGI
jgi:hypothetical protein